MTKKTSAKKKASKAAPVKRLTRKEQRKQKQQNKKERKRLFFSSKTDGKKLVAAAAAGKQQEKSAPKKRAAKPKVAPEDMPIEQLLSGQVASDEDESIGSDFSDAEVEARMPTLTKAKVKTKSQVPARPDVAVTHRRELQRQKDLENASRKQRVKQLRIENEDEEKIIAKLEKKLKLNKTKDKNRLVRKMFNDGLDYALEFCLDDAEEKAKQQLKERRKTEARQQNANSCSEDDEAMMDFGDDGDELDSEEGEQEALSDDGESDSEDGDGDSDESAVEAEQTGDKDEYKEDIYGRKRDKDGNIIKEQGSATDADPNTQPQKYIPPHQRALLALQGSSDKQAQIVERLRKHCKGLLNRLSEANLHKIATGVEELYMKNSRHNMNETLAALLNEALIGRTLAKERLVQEHMVVLAYLHAHIGSEIGAHFLQLFVEQFDQHISDIQTLQVEDKRLNNVILVLAYMYIFKIYEHRLLLQIIAKLAQNLCEKAVECLLLIFQSVGFKLRKDDPLAFKLMMQQVQLQIAAAPLELKENLRLKFMVDILNAVKNNNINKIPQFDPALAENLRKSLKALLRQDKYVITLNIALEDLLRADQVGKWWVVGSAWSGNLNEAATTAKDSGTTGEQQQRFSEKLLALAKQQKMNTDERRNIFCIIMSAEDYVDAFEKIHHLALKDQRIVAYVIIHCCLGEQRSNPYYAHLALKFCQYNRKFQLAFQFATWDRISEINALSKPQIHNLAKFLQQLILAGGLNIGVLKVVDFLQLDKSSLLLMKEIMLALLLADSEVEIYQSFERVTKNDKLAQFKNSLRLFVQHFLLEKTDSKLKLSAAQLTLLKKRADHVDNILAIVDL